MSELREPLYAGFATEQIHGGGSSRAEHGARVAPIHLSAGYIFEDAQQARDRFEGLADGYVYTRLGNPTNADLERRLARLEHGHDAIFLSSGQAAISVAFLALLNSGDHLVASNSIYEGTRGLIVANLARLGIEADFVHDTNDIDEWQRKIRPNTRLVFGESISNPTNDILDIETVSQLAHSHGIPLVVDNTAATPYLLRPIEHGADIVIHSASKFLAGHGGALGGVIVDSGRFKWDGRAGYFPQLTAPDPGLFGESYVQRYQSQAFAVFAHDVIAGRLGPTASPFNAFLIRQGIETLSLRMERHCQNAQRVAEWLAACAEVSSVDFAGLTEHRNHRIAAKYLQRGFGSVFAFTLTGGEPAAHAFIEATRIFTHMTHLGDVRSLIVHPASTSHCQRTAEQQASCGIFPGTIRLSVGIEDIGDLLTDVARGIAAVQLIDNQLAARPAAELVIPGKQPTTR
ncbi:MAG: aminotransferase class I/II-fold pyridoxal phosphate-dependent enzyme [Antricoccus sp.]